MDSEELIRRQGEAERLLASEIWTSTWTGYRVRLFAAIENAKTDEAVIRAKLMLGIANDVRALFERAIKDGQVATIELEQKKKRWFA
jgi:hypothetical protein